MDLLDQVQRRTQRWSEGWRTSVRSGWDKDFSASLWKGIFEKRWGQTFYKEGMMVLKWKWVDLDWTWGKAFYNEDGETFEQVAQRGCRHSIAGNIQSQIEWSSEEPDLFEDVPASCRGIGLDDLQMSLLSQTILWFFGYQQNHYDSTHCSISL